MVAAWARCHEFDECLRLLNRGYLPDNPSYSTSSEPGILDPWAWDVVRRAAHKGPIAHPPNEKARIELIRLYNQHIQINNQPLHLSAS